MENALTADKISKSGHLYIHFDVKEHYLNLDTFISTAMSAREIIDNFDKSLFRSSLKYEIIVIPPEDGTFLTKLAFWITGGGAAVFAFLNSDVGAAYVEGLTGKPPAHWAQEIGQEHRKSIDEMIETVERNPIPDSDLISSDGDFAACRTSEKIITAMTRGVLEKGNAELTKIGMNTVIFKNSFDARAKFYYSCFADSAVRRIGFTPDEDFTVQRQSFLERTQVPTLRIGDEENPEWVVNIESIFVTSPNWDEEDQKSRQWKGKDQSRRDCYFVIEDAEFWQLVSRKRLHVEVLDNLKVQWAYQIVEGRVRNRRVLRVLEFNGDKLADPLTPDALSSILGNVSGVVSHTEEPSLFTGWE